MKAIGAVATTQAAQTATITVGAVYAASLVTGLIWLLLGVTGLTKRVTDLISRPVAIGIVLGLGIGFMPEGSKLMAGGWMLSIVILAATLLLLSNRIVPVMFLLLVGGAAVAVFRDPHLLTDRRATRPWVVRLQQGQGRTLRDDHHRRPVRLEHRAGLRNRLAVYHLLKHGLIKL